MEKADDVMVNNFGIVERLSGGFMDTNDEHSLKM